jgi:predicted amidohydrolase
MKLTVATAQYPISKHKNFDDWQKHTTRWVEEAARQKAQLLLFPEYGSMEFLTILPEHIREGNIRQQILALESLRSDFCSVFAQLAKKHELVIVAPSFPVQEEGNTYNRAYVFSAKGLAGYQDKFFMTRFEGEEWGVKGAPKVLTLFEAPWGKFGVQICYDVEFPLGAKLLSAAGASLILAPSCTETIRGSSRVHIGAQARALETQAYLAVSQTVGDAPWCPAVELNYGETAFYCAPVLDMPEKGIMKKSKPQTEGWLVHSLDLSHLEAVRNDGRVFNFKDHQRYYSDFPDEEVRLIKKQV